MTKSNIELEITFVHRGLNMRHEFDNHIRDFVFGNKRGQLNEHFSDQIVTPTEEHTSEELNTMYCICLTAFYLSESQKNKDGEIVLKPQNIIHNTACFPLDQIVVDSLPDYAMESQQHKRDTYVEDDQWPCMILQVPMLKGGHKSMDKGNRANVDTVLELYFSRVFYNPPRKDIVESIPHQVCCRMIRSYFVPADPSLEDIYRTVKYPEGWKKQKEEDIEE